MVREILETPSAGDRGESALIQLRAWLAQRELPAASRLPPERELSELLGVSRGELRKALAIMEEQGELWRHVG
jgi:DNA-binding FadR family transcriptional regulator